MFSQQRNLDVIERGNPETPLGFYLGVDFDVLEASYVWRKPWSQRFDEGTLTEEELQDMLGRHLNVAKEISVTLCAVKPVRYAIGPGQGFRLSVRARP